MAPRASAQLGLYLATRLPYALSDCGKYDMKAIHLTLNFGEGIVASSKHRPSHRIGERPFTDKVPARQSALLVGTATYRNTKPCDLLQTGSYGEACVRWRNPSCCELDGNRVRFSFSEMCW
jgi:hypothetical protein